MKYYSEVLDKMFDTQIALMKAEAEVNKKKKEAKKQAIIDEMESLYEQNIVLDAMADKNDKRLTELDQEYASLFGESFYKIFENDYWERLTKEAPKHYSVSVVNNSNSKIENSPFSLGDNISNHKDAIDEAMKIFFPSLTIFLEEK